MLNHIVLMGRLTRDPELRYTSANIPVASNVLIIHLPVMILLSLIMFAFVCRRNEINRTAGLMFLSVYVAYIAILACMPSLA